MRSQIFSQEDFKVLKYNIIHIRSNVLESKEGRGLSRIESFKNCTRSDKDKLIKYIILMYSKESPVVSKIKDIGAKMEESAFLAGYDLEKDADLLSSLYSFKINRTTKPKNWDDKEQGEFEPDDNPEDIMFIEMVSDYLKHQNYLTWSMIVSNEQTFYEYQMALLTEVSSFRGDKDKLSATQVKTKLMEDSDAIERRLKRYYDEVFPDVEVLKKHRPVYTPEKMAKA